MSWQTKIIGAHLNVTNAVSHCERMQSDRYFVWQEDGAETLFADDRQAERTVTGSTDLFTETEFDPWVNALEMSFCLEGIPYSLRDVQYEHETGLYHYIWDWEVPDGDV